MFSRLANGGWPARSARFDTGTLYLHRWVCERSADVRVVLVLLLLVVVVVVVGHDGRSRAHAQAELPPRRLEHWILGALKPAAAHGLAPRESATALVLANM